MYEEQNTKKKKRFKLFDSQREGKGVTKEQANLPPRLKKFFILYRRDFSRLLSVNIFIVLGNFPILFLIPVLSGLFSFDFAVPALNSFTAFNGIFLQQETMSAPMLALHGIFGAQSAGSEYQTIAYVFFGISALTLFTFGLVNVGTTYLVRNMVKSDPVFMWSDFWYAVRRNFKQAFFFGIFDLVVVCLIPFNILTLSANEGFWNGILFWFNIIVGIIYIVMRRYIYLQMVTFDLSIYKILKNSLIFAIIGFKRNVLAFLGIGILIFLNLMLAYSGILLSLALAVPLLLLFSNASYMTTYAAYFKIKEYMIDPYLKEHPEENETASDEEAVEG